MTRMNGARGMVETLAQKRFFIGSLPCMAEENKREIDMLTLNAADLMPMKPVCGEFLLKLQLGV